MKTEISKNTPLKPGDIIEMHYKILLPSFAYTKAIQLAAIEHKIAENPEWEIITEQFTDDGKLILTLKVRNNPDTQQQYQQAGITAAVVALAVLGIGIFAWLSLDKIYKITDSPAGQLATAGLGAIGIAVLIIVVFTFFGKRKKKK